MINELKDILKSDQFKVWLNNPQLWESLDVDYHPPRVERVWMGYDNNRISLHVIHPCSKGNALVHGHPWDSAMYVLPIGGRYEHGIGMKYEYETEILGEMDLMEKTEIVSTQEYKGDVYYEMLNPKGVHYVRPIGMPVYTIMISTPVKYSENKTRVNKELKPLSDERKKEILEIFKLHFK